MPGINLKHKNNRSNLYRKLGLRSSLFKNAKVLEIGAGSGENAIDILTRGISSLTIFDGAQVVLDNLKANIKSDIPTDFKLHDFSYPYIQNQVFDIVICEGVIPLQKNPTAFFKNVCKTVAPGGVVLITTMDSISSLSEALRRILSIIIRTHGAFKVKNFVDFFEKDFEALDGMTRTAES